MCKENRRRIISEYLIACLKQRSCEVSKHSPNKLDDEDIYEQYLRAGVMPGDLEVKDD